MKLDGRRESTNFEDRRGMSGGAKAGMGIGGIIIALLLTWATGGNLGDFLGNTGLLEGNVTEQTADDGFAPTDAEGNDGWTMKGTYQRLEYGTAPLTGAIFGFASTSTVVDDVQVNAGEFVRAMDGAAVPALRAYLTYDGDDSVLKTRGLRTRSIDTLPQTITVQLIGKDGTVTAIGTLNTDNGQFRIDTDAWYTLGGRRLPAKPTTPGIYINGGNKVVIK